MGSQYTDQVDPVIYGKGTDGFTKKDWLELTLAALDQANLSPVVFEKIRKIIENESPVEETLWTEGKAR